MIDERSIHGTARAEDMADLNKVDSTNAAEKNFRNNQTRMIDFVRPSYGVTYRSTGARPINHQRVDHHEKRTASTGRLSVLESSRPVDHGVGINHYSERRNVKRSGAHFPFPKMSPVYEVSLRNGPDVSGNRRHAGVNYADEDEIRRSNEFDSESDVELLDDDGNPSNDRNIRKYVTRKRDYRQWIKLETYDGTTPLDTYLEHFQNCNDYNGWNESDCVAHLRASLTGNAAQVLWALHPSEVTFEASLTEIETTFWKLWTNS